MFSTLTNVNFDDHRMMEESLVLDKIKVGN